MQFKLKGRTGAALLSALVSFGFLITCIDPALAKTQTKKHPKGFVHDTAGDGAPPPPPNDYSKRPVPKWEQYDAGGLYYYQKNEIGKARQYWMESLKLAEYAVPHERATGLTPQTADACCKLILHLTYFINDVKFRPGADSNPWGIGQQKGTSISSSLSTTNPLQYQLDNIKANLKKMMEDWDWYERLGNFADRAIGKQRDCMRNICSQRELFERKIVMTRQAGQQIERQMGIDLRNSQIDTRPLKWAGVEGAGNPFATPNSNPVPLKYRGGAQPTVVGN
jgi:hypothetical protein